jgi:2-C-methyl-D-erythritol 4-phosphate cytidylyltransferase
MDRSERSANHRDESGIHRSVAERILAVKRDAAAVIVAGGQGKRFGGRVRKQYLVLSGHPLLWWSLQAFDRSPSIGGMVLVVPQEDLSRIRRQIARWHLRKPVHVVRGGSARHDSVRQGLNSVPPGYRWIAVHDAVRPLITPEGIEAVMREARKHRAAIAATPSKDTVKLSRRNHTIQRTLPRSDIWLAQTPQIFQRDLLERAHRRSVRQGITDDAQLVESLGVRIKLVETPAANLKVTVPSDLSMVQLILKGRT